MSTCEDCGETVVEETSGKPPQKIASSWAQRPEGRVLVYHDQSACVRFLAAELKATRDEVVSLRRDLERVVRRFSGPLS